MCRKLYNTKYVQLVKQWPRKTLVIATSTECKQARQRQNLFSLAVNTDLGLQCHKKGLPEPQQSVYRLSHAEIASLGQLLGGEISCGAATAAGPEQSRGDARPWLWSLCSAVLPPRWDWESAAYCSFVFRCYFTCLPHFHNAPWPPSSPNWSDEYSLVWFMIHYSPCPTLLVLHEVISVPVQKGLAGALFKNYGHEIKAFFFSSPCVSHRFLPTLLSHLEVNKRNEDITTWRSEATEWLAAQGKMRENVPSYLENLGVGKI